MSCPMTKGAMIVEATRFGEEKKIDNGPENDGTTAALVAWLCLIQTFTARLQGPGPIDSQAINPESRSTSSKKYTNNGTAASGRGLPKAAASSCPAAADCAGQVLAAAAAAVLLCCCYCYDRCCDTHN